MDKLNYLLSIRKTNPREIYDTWISFGGLKVTNSTKFYTKDSIFQIDVPDSPIYQALVYCSYEYTTNPNEGFDSIDWTVADEEKVEHIVTFYQGVNSPNFRIILSKDEYLALDKSEPTTDSFIPFSGNNQKSSAISISDEEFHIIMAELGVPFLREEELEYNKDILIEICIKPAVDQFFAYYPIVIDEAVGSVGSNQEWKVEYHGFKDNPTAVAYKAVPYITLGGATGGPSSTFGAGAFNYLRTEMMGTGAMGTGGYGFGNGITYRKPVPGFTGMSSHEAMSAALMGLAARQGYMNVFRREYERDIFIDGKRFAHGYSSLSGSLNIHWLCYDKIFEHIDYWQLPRVRKLCTAYALRNIGMLRSLVKPGDNNPIDYSLYTNRADALEKEVLDIWSKDTSSMMFAIKRGGLN